MILHEIVRRFHKLVVKICGTPTGSSAHEVETSRENESQSLNKNMQGMDAAKE